MRIFFNKRTARKVVARLKNKARVRKKINGTSARPRLCVFRSGRHIHGQLVDDVSGTTIVAASTLKVAGGCNRENAKNIGAEIAKKAMSKNIKDVVFDRSGYVYHGRIKAFADGAREAGLNF